jgi:hypothetical protein
MASEMRIVKVSCDKLAELADAVQSGSHKTEDLEKITTEIKLAVLDTQGETRALISEVREQFKSFVANMEALAADIKERITLTLQHSPSTKLVDAGVQTSPKRCMAADGALFSLDHMQLDEAHEAHRKSAAQAADRHLQSQEDYTRGGEEAAAADAPEMDAYFYRRGRIQISNPPSESKKRQQHGRHACSGDVSPDVCKKTVHLGLASGRERQDEECEKKNRLSRPSHTEKHACKHSPTSKHNIVRHKYLTRSKRAKQGPQHHTADKENSASLGQWPNGLIFSEDKRQAHEHALVCEERYLSGRSNYKQGKQENADRTGVPQAEADLPLPRTVTNATPWRRKRTTATASPPAVLGDSSARMLTGLADVERSGFHPQNSTRKRTLRKAAVKGIIPCAEPNLAMDKGQKLTAGHPMVAKDHAELSNGHQWSTGMYRQKSRSAHPANCPKALHTAEDEAGVAEAKGHISRAIFPAGKHYGDELASQQEANPSSRSKKQCASQSEHANLNLDPFALLFAKAEVCSPEESARQATAEPTVDDRDIQKEVRMRMMMQRIKRMRA